MSERVVPRDEAFDGGRVNLLPTLPALGKSVKLRMAVSRIIPGHRIESRTQPAGDTELNHVAMGAHVPLDFACQLGWY